MTPAKEASMWARVNADREAKWANRCRPCSGSGVKLIDGRYVDCPVCHGTRQRRRAA